MKIAFIGLGIMGSRMAVNLLKAGFEVNVWNRTHSRAQELTKSGAKAFTSLKECVTDAEIVFTMLSTPEAVKETAFGKEGFVQYMHANVKWFDCSTVNPSFSMECSIKAKEYGVNFIDAPVAGSKVPAEKGELIFLIGSTEEKIQDNLDLFNSMGKKNIFAGSISKGASLKMMINSMMAQSMLIFAENVKFGLSMGFDEKMLLDLLPDLPVIAPFVRYKADRIKDDNYEVEFPLEWIHKDLHLASVTAYETNCSLPLHNLAKEIYAAADSTDMSRKDFSVIYKYLKEK